MFIGRKTDKNLKEFFVVYGIENYLYVDHSIDIDQVRLLISDIAPTSALSVDMNRYNILDNRISRHFVFNLQKHIDDDGCVKKIAEYCFQEYFTDDFFLWNMTDGEDEELSKKYQKIFLKYKHLMDIEYYNPIFKDVTKVLDEEKTWYECPLCFDAWEDKTINEMTECPKCKKIMAKPQFVKDYKI
ncbi:MAG: hypothetical protein HOE80_03775 [Candidatus Magasanikbacteria bacterium]|jgi:hypothetical protein|nr:hypothetical protein [Candidatus Magasanikbacteria bacterium]MBT4071814.1 hypothetical protein [Candidatus Magasanikbacteria bacterium]